MEIKKPNDMLVATISNPNATSYDLMSIDLDTKNTSLYDKEEYKKSDYIKEMFTGEDGKFDDLKFDNLYSRAQANYLGMSDENYLKGLNELEYSPFDITRPKEAKTFKVDLEYSKDFNPFKQLYSRRSINSITDNDLSLRELAQKGQIYDPETETWSKESLNDLSLMDKLFGDTLVYAQYDSDGEHEDPFSKRMVQHKKGEWKTNSNGSLFVEKLGKRELYGKQVVNPMDVLTTDGTLANKFDFFDSDGKEKSIAKTTTKLVFDLAPFMIPGFGIFYGGVRAALSLSSVLPTFYKSFEGILMGDTVSHAGDFATSAENYMAKYAASSVSDKASESLFNYEQMSQLVGDVFSQLYEQRAAASLSRIVMRNKFKLIDDRSKVIADKINKELAGELFAKKIDLKEFVNLRDVAYSKIPELQTILNQQSRISQTLSLGYMALTTTGDIYGEALQGGYDRRTAGFAALLAATGQYGIMMNNRMANWFLDSTVGYSRNTNQALMRQSVLPWLDEIKDGFSTYSSSTAAGRSKLADVFRKVRKNTRDIFHSTSVVRESMWRNSLIEGAEEVAEEIVMDATKGIIDVMSYLGLTKKQGSFGGIDNTFSKEGFENYLMNFVGGLVGGSMFEFNRLKIEPFLNPKIVQPETAKSLYHLIANGQKNEIIKIITDQSKYWGNEDIGSVKEDGSYDIKDGEKPTISQSELITGKAVDMIEYIDGIINSQGLGHTDEDIVKKAILDHMIIKDLEAYKVLNSSKKVGLEGLILTDYLEAMQKAIDITAEINLLEKQDDAQETIKRKKQERKLYIDEVNDILEGKKTMDYFDEISFYLNKTLSEKWIAIDRNSFSKIKYRQNFNDLHDSGEGLTKKRVQEEWEDYVEGTDLRKNLKVATAAYKELELLMNKPIEDYTKSGYSEEVVKTFKNLIDLDGVIRAFNLEVDPAKKQKLLERFIEINNSLPDGQTKLPPWEVYHNDIFEQLNRLNLIKRLNFDDKGNTTVSQFTPEQLSEKVKGMEKLTIGEHNAAYVSNYFKNFPFNPLEAEKTIKVFNAQVASNNKRILAEINVLEGVENKTEDDLKRLESLKNDLVNIYIDSVEDIPEIKQIEQDYRNEIDEILKNKNISEKAWTDYLNRDKELTKEFKDLVTEINPERSDWTEFSREEYIKLADAIKENKTFDRALENHPDDLDKIMDTFNKLTDLSQVMDDTDYKTLDNIITEAADIMNTNHALNNDSELDFATAEGRAAKNRAEQAKERAKPEIFKIHNYALGLLIKELDSGNRDREVFNAAKKMVEQKLQDIKTTTFGTFKNLSEDQVLDLIQNMDSYQEELMEALASDLEVDTFVNEELEHNKPLKEILTNAFDLTLQIEDLIKAFDNAKQDLISKKSELDSVLKFLEYEKDLPTLKSNTLYDFIREYVLTLNSSNIDQVNKIFDILEREEISIRASSNISNYNYDNVRESDINQAINTLELIKSVVSSMSTTQVGYADPYGFIKSRQNFAEKMNLESTVKDLKTITSDVATLMENDLDRIIIKLNFIKELAKHNSGKMAIEQQIISDKMSKILLDKWKNNIKFNSEFVPVDELNSIINTDKSDEEKLMLIEDAVFTKNKANKKEALTSFLSSLNNTNSDDYSLIDTNVDSDKIKDWEMAMYYTTILSLKSKDVLIREKNTLNTEFDKSPFYAQNFSARMIKATIVNPELFQYTLQLKRNSLKGDADFITYILGNAGTGKTSAVFALVLDSLRQTNNNIKIWSTAPKARQAAKLQRELFKAIGKSGLESTELDKKALFDKLGLTKLMESINSELRNPKSPDNNIIKYIDTIQDIEIKLPENWEADIDFDSLPNILAIDEITHFSWVDQIVLNLVSIASYNNDSSNFMKIIAAGDTTQLGYLLKVDGGDGNTNFYNYNVNKLNGLFTPRLRSTIRSSNSQKRENDEMMVELNRQIESKYNNISTQDELSRANREAKAFLDDVDTVTNLAYHISDTIINGDVILDNYDKNVFQTLARIVNDETLGEKKTIGIITQNGEIDPKISAMLSEVGIITAEGLPTNVEVYKLDDVQGSEVDYVIFNANILDRFDKLRENLKALYTYSSRSVNGSIIIDTENVIKNKLSIENASMDPTTEWKQVITKEVTQENKAKRLEKLTNMLGENPEITDDFFKFKTGNEEVETEGEGEDAGVVLGGIAVTRSNNAVQETDREPASNTKKFFEKLTAEEKADGNYEFMLHSFYNSPNADLTDGKIIVNRENHKSDLNLLQDVTNKEKAEKIIQSWTNLKYFLLANANGDNMNIMDTSFDDYIQQIFNLNTKIYRIGVEFVLTATDYNSELNDSYAKELADGVIENKLKNGEPFINLSAKLTFGEASHYVTLATFANSNKILEKIESTFGKQKDSKMYTNFTNKFEQIKEALKKQEKGTVLELSTVKGKIEYITSTRLLKPAVKNTKYFLNNFSKQFPGMKRSDIKIFPSSEKTFTNVINKYTFGERRTPEAISKLFKTLKNKPYVVISYRNDLDGSFSENTFARFVPLSANSRDLNTLIAEVNEFRKKLKNEAHTQYEEDPNADPFEKKIKFSDDISAEGDIFLSQSQLLDILITWNRTKTRDGESYLDLMLKPFSMDRQLLGEKKINMLDVLNRFRTTNLTQKNLETVIDLIRTQDSKLDDTVIKNNILQKVKGIKGWGWSFYNLFDEFVIKGERDAGNNYYRSVGVLKKNESLHEDTYNGLQEIANTLLESLQGMNFYYSIPIKTVKNTKGELKVNDYISGEKGNLLDNKVFINVIPESGRMLINLKEFMEGSELNFTANEVKTEEFDLVKHKQYVDSLVNNFRNNPLTEDSIEDLMLKLDNAITTLLENGLDNDANEIVELRKELGIEIANIQKTKTRNVESGMSKMKETFPTISEALDNIYENLSDEFKIAFNTNIDSIIKEELINIAGKDGPDIWSTALESNLPILESIVAKLGLKNRLRINALLKSLGIVDNNIIEVLGKNLDTEIKNTRKVLTDCP